ncbi:MAG: amino acid ABC transporter permease [Oscillospiraceae bacterium]|jgi:glutamine transport system permease protein|nr:amino acid ABC transporter permease [Oscillospiraceae bacterium]
MNTAIITLVPMLMSGLQLTVLVAAVGILCGFVIGSVAGYALQSRSRVARTLAFVYIWLIRGTPIIVQALYIYYVLPLMLGSNIPSTTAGIIVISINSGAFIAEIVRGALESVDNGQKEAGRSLGMSNLQVLIHVVIPPAFRQMVPALFNQFIISLKDTSMLTIIVVNEMTQKAMSYAALTFDYVTTYSLLALFYLALISLLMVLQKFVERRMNLQRVPKPRLKDLKNKKLAA